MRSISAPDAANDGDISKHTAAVRGARAIANASGHQVKSIGVTWTDDADAKATLLLKSLPDLGFRKVVTVRPPQAIKAWAQAFGSDPRFRRSVRCASSNPRP